MVVKSEIGEVGGGGKEEKSGEEEGMFVALLKKVTPSIIQTQSR